MKSEETKKEWSMGNGQCPECCGVPPSWYGHPCHRKASSIGHERKCSLAAAIPSALYRGQWTVPDDFVMPLRYQHDPEADAALRKGFDDLLFKLLAG